ncbi:MAG: XapX domain-containing protein [Anaerolineales bacterium]|nr:XapX domain-containing protein [Anaerolineales bacterium]
MGFGTGFLVGVIFAVARLQVPAPYDVEGVAGVAGITIGYLVIEFFRGRAES